MNFTNIIYLILWFFVFIFSLVFIPYVESLIQSLPTIGSYWNNIPTETIQILNIFLYIVIPLVAIAYAIKSSSPENQIVVSQ